MQNDMPWEGISNEELENILSNKPDEYVLLDVRTANEFAEGHIPQAMNIDFNDLDFVDKIKKLNPQKKYLICCYSGQRSYFAASIMYDNGFKKLAHLDSGVKDWQSKKFPLEKN